MCVDNLRIGSKYPQTTCLRIFFSFITQKSKLVEKLGYSVNSTIVIFDRIRENKSAFQTGHAAEKINKSVSQTLARSINTSLTTLFTIGAIYILGGPVWNADLFSRIRSKITIVELTEYPSIVSSTAMND